MFQTFGKIDNRNSKIKLKTLEKDVVNRADKEKSPNEHKFVSPTTKKMKDFKQTSITATVDSKNCSDEFDTESYEKKKKFKKVFLTKNKMAPPDNSNPFPPIKTFSSSSSCSSIVEDLIAFTRNSEFADQSKASSEASTSAVKTCKEAEKPAKITVSGTFINVSF